MQDEDYQAQQDFEAEQEAIANANAQGEAEAQAANAEAEAEQEQEFGCKKHGIDYRITCEECQINYEKFSKIVKEQIKTNSK